MRDAVRSVDRQRVSGLMAISIAAKQTIVDRMDVAIDGGIQSIGLVRTPQMYVASDLELLAMRGDVQLSLPMAQKEERIEEDERHLGHL